MSGSDARAVEFGLVSFWLISCVFCLEVSHHDDSRSATFYGDLDHITSQSHHITTTPGPPPSTAIWTRRPVFWPARSPFVPPPTLRVCRASGSTRPPTAIPTYRLSGPTPRRKSAGTGTGWLIVIRTVTGFRPVSCRIMHSPCPHSVFIAKTEIHDSGQKVVQC